MVFLGLMSDVAERGHGGEKEEGQGCWMESMHRGISGAELSLRVRLIVCFLHGS